MQRAWAREHGLQVEEGSEFSQQNRSILQWGVGIAAKTPLRYLRSVLRPVLRSLDSQQSWFYNVLAEQIKHYKPDILLNQVMGMVSNAFLGEMKPHVRLLVGQHAATRLPDSESWRCYDIVISSFPPTVDWFHHKGIPVELNRLAFDPRVLSHLSNNPRNVGISFIGSFFPSIHSSRVALLEQLCTKFDVRIWGPDVNHLNNPAIKKAYMGQSWGIEMYRVLNASKITLNHHGDIEPYANNCRLYEATGVGTLLITDWKENLHEMFEPGKEVVVYRNAEECSELIQYYLEHDEERETIAQAGQERTLKEHTYHDRMQRLVNIVRKYL